MRGDGEKFLELYSEADSFAKRVSEFRQEVSIPAYNQLRYAGHHFVEAIASDSQSDYDERLREAVSHCKRAMYDATEAGLTAITKRVELFKEQYKDIPIGDVVKDLESIYVLMDDIVAELIKGRNKKMSISQALAKRIELFDEGVVALKRLNANRDDLNRKQEKNLSKRRRFIITTVLSVGVFVILLLNLLVRLGVFE